MIPARARPHPDFTFVAEAYWDREWDLLQQGFDHCYDKRLYDRLVHESAGPVRGHLAGDVDYQGHLLRFVENHDEPRAAATFPPARQRAVTVATLTQAGMRLVHEGQLGGARTRLPVFLGRFPDEPVDESLVGVPPLAARRPRRPRLPRGRLAAGCDRSGWAGNDGYDNLVAWTWDGRPPAGWSSSTCRARAAGRVGHRLGRPAGPHGPPGRPDGVDDLRPQRRRPRRRPLRASSTPGSGTCSAVDQ